MSLFKMWEDALKAGKLPKEWAKWDSFRAWAIKNKYKAEYGYKGEFTPEGCLKAMPDYQPSETERLKQNVVSGEMTINSVRNEVELESISEGDETLVEYEIIGIDLGDGPDKTGVVNNLNSLMRMRLDELKQLAIDKEIDIGEATTKKEIATLICGCGGEDNGQD